MYKLLVESGNKLAPKGVEKSFGGYFNGIDQSLSGASSSSKVRRHVDYGTKLDDVWSLNGRQTNYSVRHLDVTALSLCILK
jgi:hypothetical protein